MKASIAFEFIFADHGEWGLFGLTKPAGDALYNKPKIGDLLKTGKSGEIADYIQKALDNLVAVTPTKKAIR